MDSSMQAQHSRNSRRLASGKGRRLRKMNSSEAQQLGSREFASEDDGSIPRVWAFTASGEFVFLPGGSCLERQAHWTAALSVHAASRRAVAVGSEGIPTMWDLQAGTSRKLQGSSLGCARVIDVDWTVGNIAWIGTDTGRLSCWDLASGQCVRVLPTILGLISSLAVNWTKSRALVGHGDAGLVVLSLETGDPLMSIEGHLCVVTSIATNWDTNRAICGSGDGVVAYWDLRRRSVEQVLRGHKGSVTAVSVDWSTFQVLSASEDSSLKLWALKTGDCLRTFNGHSVAVQSIAVDWIAGYLASGAADGEVLLWTVRRAASPTRLRVGCEGIAEGVTALGIICAVSATSSFEDEPAFEFKI